jgi:hypothetical protein
MPSPGDVRWGEAPVLMRVVAVRWRRVEYASSEGRQAKYANLVLRRQGGHANLEVPPLLGVKQVPPLASGISTIPLP